VNARPQLASGPWLRVLLLALATCALVLGAVAANAAPGHSTAIRAAGASSTAGRANAAHCPKPSSLSPSGLAVATSGSFMATIRKRGYLIAGVDQNTYPFGFYRPADGQIEGFDIDMVRAVAKAIFGNKPHDIVYKAISDDQRIPDIESGAVDIVAHTMSILPSRLKCVDFSSVYFEAGQRVLVLKGSPFHSLDDLKGQKVCAVASTDSLGVIAAHGAVPVPVTYWTDCLVLLQQGEVAAISTDDSILAGLAAQDPWTHLVGKRLTDEFYGLAISKKQPDFVRFVNAVLQQMRTDGQWAASYKRWIGSPVPAPPPAQYRG
jgi:polar amino acid transport system substrate-binding protein